MAISHAARALADAPGAHAVAASSKSPTPTRRRDWRRRAASVELRHVRLHRADTARGAGTPTRPTCCAPCARRWPSARPTSTSSASASRRSPPAPRSASTTRWRRTPSAPPWCRPIIGWSDVGSWGALWELGSKDAAGNVAVGDVLLENARNCYVRSDGMLAAVVGLEDAVVVVTEDAVLAMHRDHAQDVKKVVDRLKAAGRHEAVAHNRMLSALGLLREPDPGRPLPGQAHRGLARAASCRCRSTTTAPSTGWW